MTYLWIGYVVTWVAVVGFAWRLERRASDAARRLEGTGGSGPGGRPGGMGPGRVGQGTVEGETSGDAPADEASPGAGSD